MREWGFTDCERGVVDACVEDNSFLIPLVFAAVLVLFLFVRWLIKTDKAARDSVDDMLTEVTVMKRTVVFYGLCGIKCERLTICKFQLDDYISEGWTCA
jgi:hypothetical protein